MSRQYCFRKYQVLCYAFQDPSFFQISLQPIPVCFRQFKEVHELEVRTRLNHPIFNVRFALYRASYHGTVAVV